VVTPTSKDILLPSHDVAPDEDPALRSARWMIQLRWLAGASILCGTALAWAAGVIAHAVPLLAVGGLVLAFNLGARAAFYRRKARKSPHRVLPQMIGDLTALTALVYFCGGVASPLILFYIFHMICSGALLSPGRSYLMAAVATALFSLVAVAQCVFPSLYHPLVAGDVGRVYTEWPFVGLELAIFATGMFVSVYLTTTIAVRLRASEERIVRQRDVLDAIISSMSEALVFLTPDGRPVLWNAAAERWFSIEQHAAAGVSLADADLPEALVTYIRRAAEADAPLPGETFSVEIAAGSEKQMRQFQVSADDVLDDGGRHLGYVIVAEDLTEQRQLEQDLRTRNREVLGMSERLRRTQHEMAQREKMVALGTMAAGVAHEVGNPLACMSAILQVLRRRDHTAQQGRDLTTLDEQIQRIAKIVKQMVEFARPAASEWVLADVDELTEQAVKLVGYSHRARHARIDSVRNADLPKVQVMPQQFQQVVINVVLNALDAVAARADAPVVRAHREADENWVTVVVSDEGVGMTQEQARNAFELFYTTKPPGEGTGLGLAVSYKLMERQGGQIEISSRAGEGTEVRITLPVSQPGPEAGDLSAAGRTEAAPPSGGSS